MAEFSKDWPPGVREGYLKAQRDSLADEIANLQPGMQSSIDALHDLTDKLTEGIYKGDNLRSGDGS